MSGSGYSHERDTAEAAASADPAPQGPDLSRLVHELRTPLGAISILAEILRDERLGPLGNEKYRGYAADLHQSAAHANAVLQAFLDPSPAGAATGGPMEFAELAVEPIVAGAVSALMPLAERAGVSLSEKLGALPHVIADRRSIRQMLNNLIANSLKFTPPGGKIVVSVSYSPGGPVVVEVADNGDGMSEAELARVRSGGKPAEALRRRGGGSGIGIPLVRALATANGASLEIDSALGAGTKVRIAFPHDRIVPV